MVMAAQWLPIALIPEQGFVASMRDDVIDHISRTGHPFG